MIFTSVYRAAPQWAQQALIEVRKAGLRWACLFWVLGAVAVIAVLQRRTLRAKS